MVIAALDVAPNEAPTTLVKFTSNCWLVSISVSSIIDIETVEHQANIFRLVEFVAYFAEEAIRKQWDERLRGQHTRKFAMRGEDCLPVCRCSSENLRERSGKITDYIEWELGECGTKYAWFSGE